MKGKTPARADPYMCYSYLVGGLSGLKFVDAVLVTGVERVGVYCGIMDIFERSGKW